MLMSAAFLASAVVQFALGLIVAALLGPAEFGLYALGFAASVIGQTMAFEAIRLAITRFSGADVTLLARLGRPLYGLFGVMAVLGLAGLLAYPERGTLMVLIALGAATLGLAEIRAAKMRAGFAERSYAAFLIARNGASIILVPAATLMMPRAEIALGALIVSVWLALGITWHRQASSAPADGSLSPPISLNTAMRYAAPIVLTNLAYLALFFGLRALVAADAGLARSGQFSLALELGLKLVMTMGTTLDLYLFQLAVRARDQSGEAAGLLQLESNARVILAVIAPTILGFWLVLPSVEVLLIAPAYRGAFAHDLTALLPALLLFASIQYVIHPAFQLSTRTTSIGMAALLVLLITALSWWGGRALGFGSASLAAGALGLGLAAGSIWLLCRANLAKAFRFGDLRRLALALTGLMMVVLPARYFLEPGIVNLGVSVLSGLAAFAMLAWLVDLAHIRAFWRGSRPKTGAL